jgi:hypothetical protein
MYYSIHYHAYYMYSLHIYQYIFNAICPLIINITYKMYFDKIEIAYLIKTINYSIFIIIIILNNVIYDTTYKINTYYIM